MQKEKKKNDSLFIAVSALLYGGYTLACIFLYYMQATVGSEAQYLSDLPAHLQMAEDGWGYSLTALIYRFFMLLPGYKLWVAIFLGAATGGTMVVTYFAIRNFVYGKWAALCSAICVNIVMPCYFYAVHYQRYVGYQSPSIWHNSTYIVMKLVAALTLIFYLRVAHDYKKKMPWKYFILFAVFLTLSTAVKTSFLLVFAPVALIGLFFDFARKVPLKRILLFASAILPSLAIIVFQEAVLFGEDTENGIVFEFGYNVYLRAERPYFTMILSALFPVLIFLFNIVPVIKETLRDFKAKRLPRHTFFILGWAMWVVGAFELLFLKETGQRALDGNFSWGYDFTLFVLFVLSILYFMNNLRSVRFLGGNKILRGAYTVITGAVLVYHMYCGALFFVRLLLGESYFMMA